MATGPHNELALATKRGCFRFSFDGKSLKKKSTANRSLCLSVAYSDAGKLFIGTSNGSICVSSSKGKKACNGSVFALCAKDGKVYASGAK